ncbi:ABC transporter ATP-binding protein [Nocardia cyriacigeorgica]|uniref:ABC transporter ATP-binding protein n=1 Tax=Nocardia cyriacigeorgica TaxID=135487 RepID=UPI00245765EC|nr:ABC transporter ATP-binding protein [Nocardia cyriacigeorgica]
MSGPATAPALRAENLTLGYNGTDVVRDMTLDIPSGAVTSVIGPNGCGKSTLLRGLGRLLRPTSGRVLLDGVPIDAQPTRTVAQRISILPQSPVAPPGLTVADLVSRGRHPRQRWYEQFSVLDEASLRQSLSSTGLLDLANARLEELSGGQRQRAWISMTLAQETDIMLLDEPTTYLDLAHQVELLELIVRLNRECDRTIVMVLHDISLAARYSDHLVVMKDGAIVIQGAPDDVVRPDVLRDVFGLAAHVVTEPAEGRPHVIPLGSVAT